jgi:hypothetical protein
MRYKGRDKTDRDRERWNDIEMKGYTYTHIITTYPKSTIVTSCIKLSWLLIWGGKR